MPKVKTENMVAFQGERGAFSEDAVARLFGDVSVLPYRSFADVFASVRQGKVAFGVVPVENSQAGSINETYDLLLQYDLTICGEVNLRISHAFMTRPGETLESIRRVYSHPQALAQCESFLSKLQVEIMPSYDTAGSAKMIREQNLMQSAAIASKRAARFYELKILAENIETNPRNYTKFLAISKKKAERAARNKTSIIFTLNNIPGSLYACMGTFARRQINLTKLESRPSRDNPWEYVFYADFEGHMDDEPYREALAELRQHNSLVKILGSYPIAEEQL